MNIKTLSREKAEQAFINIPFVNFNNYFNSLNKEYDKIRKDIISFHNKYLDYKEYSYDLYFGLDIYNYFTSLSWFTDSIASNYDFWRYICINVVPDIIYMRHGDNCEYYYKKNVRMYIPTLWWYIHMSYQGNMEITLEILKNNSTDTILNCVERPGKKGVYLETYRKIMFYYSKVDRSKRTYMNKIEDRKTRIIKEKKYDLFRLIMTLHTAKSLAMNPEIYNGGIDGYVRMLFNSYNIKFGWDNNGNS